MDPELHYIRPDGQGSGEVMGSGLSQGESIIFGRNNNFDDDGIQHEQRMASPDKYET